MEKDLVTAVHEAGHVIVGRGLGLTFFGYVRDSDEFGEYCAAKMSVPQLHQLSTLKAAGAAAEIVYFGEIHSTCQQLRGDLTGFRSWRTFAHTATMMADEINPDSLLNEVPIAAEAFR